MKSKTTSNNDALESLMVEVTLIKVAINEMREKKSLKMLGSPFSVTAMPSSPETRIPLLKFSEFEPQCISPTRSKLKSSQLINPCSTPVKTKPGLFAYTVCNQNSPQQRKKNHIYSSIGPAHS